MIEVIPSFYYKKSMFDLISGVVSLNFLLVFFSCFQKGKTVFQNNSLWRLHLLSAFNLQGSNT